MSRPCTGCEVSSLLCDCHHPLKDRVCFPILGVDRVKFDQALLPSSMGPTPKEVPTEESQAHVVTVDLCATRAGVCVSAQEQPRVIPLWPLYSSQTECYAVMCPGLQLGHCGCRNQGGGVAAWHWGCLCDRVLPRTCLPQISSKLGGDVGRTGALLLGKELLLTSLQRLSIRYHDSLTLPTTHCAKQSPLLLDLPALL